MTPPSWGPTRARRPAREGPLEAQRMRILSAIAQLACLGTAKSASVSQIVAMAGVSRTSFYALFENRGDCLLAAVEHALSVASERATGACSTQDRWVDRVRTGLLALLYFFEEEPQLARLCLVESATAGPSALAHRRQVLDHLAQAIDEGRSVALREPPLPTAEGLVGGVAAVISARLLKPDQGGALVELTNPLMSLIVRPYLGSVAARKELSKHVAATRVQDKRSASRDPLERLDMRVTHRTIKVLAAIAAQPGLNNNDAAARAGVTSQAQISRMLSRLARLGLVENTGKCPERPNANAWHLTRRGSEVERAVRRVPVSAGPQTEPGSAVKLRLEL
jgi:AcrR family transcriptional regulator